MASYKFLLQDFNQNYNDLKVLLVLPKYILNLTQFNFLIDKIWLTIHCSPTHTQQNNIKSYH